MTPPDPLMQELETLAASAKEGGYDKDAATIATAMDRIRQLNACVLEHVTQYFAQRELSAEAFAAIGYEREDS